MVSDQSEFCFHPIRIEWKGTPCLWISHYFDCFECAIHALAPECEHCGCKIIGHGIESGGSFFCCAHCAHEEGVTAAVDHA